MASTISWRDSFRVRQQCVVVSELAKAGEYLRNAQDDSGGWGIRPRLPCDIHSTTLAIEALSHFVDEGSRLGAAKGAVHLMRLKRCCLEDLRLEELTDLVNAASAEQLPDTDYLSALCSAIKRRLGKETSDGQVPAIVVATLLSSLSKTRGMDASFAEPWFERLEKWQSKEDGGWSVLPTGPTSVVATAFAIRALSGESHAQEAIQRGVSFLMSTIKRDGWDALGGKDDVFTQAIVLRAISELVFVPYDIIAAGVTVLVKSANPDGGWGGTKTEPSNVENTALSAMALLAAGEARFIPLRLAEAAVQDGDEVLARVTEERDQLRERFDKELETKSGQLLSELKDLRSQNQSLRSENEGLRTKNKDLRSRSEELESRSDEFLRLARARLALQSPGTLSPYLSALFLIVPAATIPILIWVLMNSREAKSIWSWVILAATIAGLFAASYFLLRRLTLSRTVALSRSFERSSYPLFRSHTEDLIDTSWSVRSEIYLEPFLRLNARLPSTIREELLYRLSTDFPEMPPDIARRYARDLAVRFSFPPEENRLLIEWLERMSHLAPRDRRVLLESVLRARMK